MVVVSPAGFPTSNSLTTAARFIWPRNYSLTQQMNLAPAQQQSDQGGRGGALFLNNDADIAGLQWDKLEKAQQVAVTKVAPLRVNLPTRGVHYSFAQVLQTELRKPMTIRLLAENTKAPSWTARIALLLLGFALLWRLMAAVNRRTAHPPR